MHLLSLLLLYFRLSGKSNTVLNMGSYNYLGFAQNAGPCAEYVKENIPKYGCGVGSYRHELGRLKRKIEFSQ